MADFDVWSRHEPGEQEVCIPLRSQRSTLAAASRSKGWRVISRQLHLMALAALDLKGWGAALAGRARRYRSAAGRARMLSASRLIADGADDLYLALSDLAGAYAGLAAWNCDQSGLYLASGGEFARGHVDLNHGFATIPLTGPLAH